ncbi:MAG: L-serine ammonia-lyase [Bacteroidales bacterium]|nr:L-serine ammonia-lyase [Bacteroidales bacterium]
MESIKEIYRIGNGPSSSHTIGPKNAAIAFLKRTPNANSYKVTLYGSLAATGKGHLTDLAILSVLSQERATILWEPETFLPFHPNGMRFVALNDKGDVIDDWIIYSVGGGKIADENTELKAQENHIYPHKNISEILDYIDERGLTFWEYVERYEEKDIWDYLANIWHTMKESVEDGLQEEGVLPGGLHLRRKAMSYYTKSKSYKTSLIGRTSVQAYALAVAEHNASGGVIVTAPTCGSSGVLPAVLYHLSKEHGFSDKQIVWALATAGVFGTSIKFNASISGAEVGCQGEIGSACSMAAAGLAQLTEMNLDQIEYSAEVAMEHHLGLTCDPVCGLVQIPCIERNAVAAMRAINAVNIADFLTNTRKVSLDTIINTMYQTGKDMSSLYRETSQGGLAKTYKR